jgi:predicted GIY-YIG superfamily endonuclease
MSEQNETINIISLVEENPINKLVDDKNSKLICKIKEKFNTYEQQLFVANIYCYINYDTEHDYVIKLDDMWKWLGYKRIEECKKCLLKHFEENKHFTIGKIEKVYFPSTGGEKNETRGRQKENILMTVDCFKKLCLKAGTKKADEIHDYYIKLEKVITETAKEESEKLRNQLQIKDTQLQIAQKENLTIKEKTMIDAYFEKPTLYLAIAENKIAKFGFSNDLKTRINTHKREIGDQFVLHYVIESVYNREIENMIKRNLKDKIMSKKYAWNIYT